MAVDIPLKEPIGCRFHTILHNDGDRIAERLIQSASQSKLQLAQGYFVGVLSYAFDEDSPVLDLILRFLKENDAGTSHFFCESRFNDYLMFCFGPDRNNAEISENLFHGLNKYYEEWANNMVDVVLQGVCYLSSVGRDGEGQIEIRWKR